MPNVTLTAEDFNALMAEREAAVTEREALRGELKVVKVERDLLKEKLNAFLRKLFAAKSEARGNGQSDLFNEAEALASADGPVTEEVSIESGIEIAGDTRQKRGRNPSIRRCRARSFAMSCRNPNGFVRTMARPWWKSASKPANNWISFHNRFASFRTSASNKGLIAFKGSNRYFGLEGSGVVASRSSHCSLLLLVGDFCRPLKQMGWTPPTRRRL